MRERDKPTAIAFKLKKGTMFSIEHFVDVSGDDPFEVWFDAISDLRGKARISARVTRLQYGLFGDCRPVGSGVWELKIDWGPGYRVYYAICQENVILLCGGGVKRTQRADIDRAIKRWKLWQREGRT